MFNRMSFVCLAVGILVGYVFGGTPMTAQSATYTLLPNVMHMPNPTVSLVFEAGAVAEGRSQITCNVGEIVGDWVRCKASDSFQDEREQRWYDMKHVVQIIKREK